MNTGVNSSAKQHAFKRLSMIQLLTMLIFVLTPQASGATGNNPVQVEVDPTLAEGASTLTLGITHTQVFWENGESEAVQRAKDLLAPVITYQNQHIMGWGADNPQPEEGGPIIFDSLDRRVDLMRSLGGEMVLTFCTAPGWMKTSGDDWNMDDRVADEHVDEFAELAAAIAARYQDVKYFQIWNEFKGYWDNSIRNSDGSNGNYDYVRYTQLYNAVYAAVKKVRPDAEIGGYYISLKGDASHTLGFNGNGTETPFTARDMDSMEYWLNHKAGADFIALDRWLKDWGNPNMMTEQESMQLTWVYKKAIEDIRAKTDLPIWFSEYYTLYDTEGGSQYIAAAMASIYANMIKAAGDSPITALLWNPSEGEAGVNHYLFSSTNSPTGGRHTPHYEVYKGMHDYFPAGTPLFQSISSDPDIETLASASKIMLINKDSVQRHVDVNGTPYTLAPYQVLFADAPYALSDLTLSTDISRLKFKETSQLKINGLLRDGSPADLSSAMIEFTSSNPRVATVAANGLVTGHKQGSVQLTAQVTLNGIKLHSNAVTVNVKNGKG